MALFSKNLRNFFSLSEQEILALAIASEEDDARIFRHYADHLRDNFPHSAAVFDEMVLEEEQHYNMLVEAYAARFGDIVPLIRREHVSDFLRRRPTWLVKTLGLDAIRAEARMMEREAAQFYKMAADRVSDPEIHQLLRDLAAAESHHSDLVKELEEKHGTKKKRRIERLEARRQFVLTWVQPGLAGLMDGSISTLAPIFATAFATRDPHTTLMVGLAASIGAGISMGFTEAASDDGVITQRGSPIKRGIASGVMTTLGGLGHALPYLIMDFWLATAVAVLVVFFELWLIAWIQHKFMKTSFRRAVIQVVLGGALVLAVGTIIGSA